MMGQVGFDELKLLTQMAKPKNSISPKETAPIYILIKTVELSKTCDFNINNFLIFVLTFFLGGVLYSRNLLVKKKKKKNFPHHLEIKINRELFQGNFLFIYQYFILMFFTQFFLER